MKLLLKGDYKICIVQNLVVEDLFFNTWFEFDCDGNCRFLVFVNIGTLEIELITYQKFIY